MNKHLAIQQPSQPSVAYASCLQTSAIIVRPLLLSFLPMAFFLLSSGCALSRKAPHIDNASQEQTDTLVHNHRADSLPPHEDTTTPEKIAPPALSTASQLLIKACNNYLFINPESPKKAEVLMIMGSIYNNNRFYDSARIVYTMVMQEFKGSSYAFESIRMIAQTFYLEKRFDEAQKWYKTLSEAASEGVDKAEAIERIAESIFRMAEVFESESRYKDAAEQYERVALEYPQSPIADVALFNAAVDYEKQAEWPHAILVLQRLLNNYTTSKLLPKARFRIAKSYEKLQQWDIAAENYLRVTSTYPRNELAPVALYNAGFCFENGNKLREAAATFEKMSQLYPNSEDAADVLFRAGELYGKLKEWEAVSRVNQVFSSRFGNDESRIVQALCMTGIALYMQNQESKAVVQLNKAFSTYEQLKEPGPMNAYYAAKAMYTIGEIQQTAMNAIALSNVRRQYKKQLSQKSNLLDKTISAYTRVITLRISEWTTRSIFQIGQTYEDFAIGIFNQKRPTKISLANRISLELGIAEAVEKYFIEKAAHYHEQNVKLALKESLEDKYVLLSRQKLTYLPYTAASNYLALTEIARTAQGAKSASGFALIANKLTLLQKIAPFQERAIGLLLKGLELGTTYQEVNDFYKKASDVITGISYNVGETYADVVSIARNAPIPDGFDDYEHFAYKTKLLSQIEGYEDQALNNYLKTVKIAEAYKLTDTSVTKAKFNIGKLLFERGRCYDLLCTTAFSNPPFPRSIDEAEKDEYRARFEEIALKFQEQAFDIYKSILLFASQNYAKGNYVTHAYVRLYQNYPEKYGTREHQLIKTAISSGPQWNAAPDSAPGWTSFEFNDSLWGTARRATIETQPIKGFPDKVPIPMWLPVDTTEQQTPDTLGRTAYFRRTFSTKEMPHTAILYLYAKGRLSIYLNGNPLSTDTASAHPRTARTWDLMGKMRSGTNVVAIKVAASTNFHHALLPLLLMTIGTDTPQAKPPHYDKSLPPEQVRVDVYQFPPIKNFSPPEPGEK